MATTYGLTSAGWVTKPTAVIAGELDTGLKKILGASAGTNADGSIPASSMAGQLKTLMLDGFAGFWQLLQAVVSANDPNQANDAALDVVCALNGVIREPAQYSTATYTATGTPNTPLPVGRVITVVGTGARFDTQAAASLSDPNYPASTIAAVAAWAQSTGYTIGARVTANGNVYQCTAGGTSAGVGTGPSGTTLGAPIADGSVTWVFLGAGTGAVDIPVIAEVAGAIGATNNALTQIATPINGWSGGTNLLAAAPGNTQETNSALRNRRANEVAAGGNCNPDAIRAHLLLVNQGSTDPNHQPPTSVKVLFNDSDVTDSRGLPPHSVECIVQGGTDADIAQAIWTAVGAGTNTYSGTGHSSTVTDSQGQTQTVFWTRPVARPIYIVGTIWYDPSQWPSTGAAALVNQAAISALMTFGLTYAPGTSVRRSPLTAAVLEGPSSTSSAGAAVYPAPAGSLPAPGLLDADPFYIGFSPSPATSTPLAIGVREIATFDPSRIAFTCTSESP